MVTERGRRHLRSSSHRTLDVPRTRTTLGDRSFAVSRTACVNSLPDHQYGQFVGSISEIAFIQGLEIAAHCDS